MEAHFENFCNSTLNTKSRITKGNGWGDSSWHAEKYFDHFLAKIPHYIQWYCPFNDIALSLSLNLMIRRCNTIVYGVFVSVSVSLSTEPQLWLEMRQDVKFRTRLMCKMDTLPTTPIQHHRCNSTNRVWGERMWYAYHRGRWKRETGKHGGVFFTESQACLLTWSADE